MMAAINSPNCSVVSGLVVFSAWRRARDGIGLRETPVTAERLGSAAQRNRELMAAILRLKVRGFIRKASAEKLKAFISRTTDLSRRKYGKGTERIPRRSVFWGTANKSPMADRTGSTRFVLIELPDKKLPLSRVRLDRDAFWRRALGAYRDRFQSYSTDSELDRVVGGNRCCGKKYERRPE